MSDKEVKQFIIERLNRINSVIRSYEDESVELGVNIEEDRLYLALHVEKKTLNRLLRSI